MLKRLSIKNFKAAQNLDLRLAPMTLLTGLNSSGKSTVLQSLALLRQSIVGRNLPGIALYGQILQLGALDDILTEGAETDVITIGIETTEGRWTCEFSAQQNNDFGFILSVPDWIPSFLLSEDFQFLQAERIAPKTLFPRAPELGSNSGVLGPKGEFSIQFLASEHADIFEVRELRRCPRTSPFASNELMHKVAPTERLLAQVSGWLQQVSPGVRIMADPVSGTDEYRLLYDYVGRSGVSESDRKIRPANVGFGLTYCLPIIISCLVAEPGSLLLIENPEAHLHPQGQAAMGELIARTCADGVQVITETHSDHFLNGARLAVKRGLISSDQVAIHYFTREVETGFANVVSPAVLANGRLSGWPKGFFDQWDNAVDELLSD